MARMPFFQVFPALVKLVNWERFYSYARCVRSLRWDDSQALYTQKGLSGAVSSTVFSNAYLNYPLSGSLLPNATEFRWMTRSSTDAVLELLPFLSVWVESLHIELTRGCRSDVVDTLLHRLGSREPGVINFELFVHNDVKEVQNALAACFGRMQALRTVTLPRRFGTSTVVAALERLKQIEEVFESETLPRRWKEETSEEGIQWDVKLQRFKKLRTLEFIPPSAEPKLRLLAVLLRA